MTPHNNMPEPFVLPAKSVYASKTFFLDVETVRMNMVANTFMRAPGEAVGTFGLESAMDELAVELAMDPIALRIRNEPEKDPVDWTALLPARDRAGMAGRRQAVRLGQARLNPRIPPRGRLAYRHGLRNRHLSLLSDAGRSSAPDRHTRGSRDRRHRRSMGMGTATAQAQVAAERLGLPLKQVEVLYGDTLFPGAVLAGGSQQTAAIGASIIAAHRALVKELLKLARNDSPLAGLSPDEVGGIDGGLSALEDESRRESYASILGRARREEVTVEAEAPMPLELQHWSMHSHSALFCEVRVNTVTGEARVSRFLGSFDCGRILNAKTAASQFRGGIIMGLGLALMEEISFDERSGRIMNPSLAEYQVPVHMDVPDIDVIWTDEPDPHAPVGARGVGEIGITGVGAAIANAVFNATGKRVRDLPITLHKVM